jgi:Na+-translocating ferredoxin:NAD+ oxidoreductase subunit B
MAKGENPNFDYELCMACGACVQACPFSCLELSRIGLDALRKAYPELVFPEKCTGCGICARACPVDCVALARGE